MLASQMAQRLQETRTFEAAIQTVLDDVIALLGAEYGNIQLSLGDELAIVAQRGLSADFLKAFKRVKKDDGSACGQALRLGGTVVIRDVEADLEFAAFRPDAKRAGFRSVQSTPFLREDGSLIGMVSTHFATVHEPTQIEMWTLKAYSRVAADHLYQLLGDVPLAIKAKQMSDDLYSRIFGSEIAAIDPNPSGVSTSL